MTATAAPTPTASAASPSRTPHATATVSATAARPTEPPQTRTATPAPSGTPAALCAGRRGGALISLAICDETLAVWSTADAFIDTARELLASGEGLIPIFATLLDGSDCDAQWSWHPDAAHMSFAELAIELCDGCPSHIEADKTYWLTVVRQYCPWSARVSAVDDRRP